MNILALVTDSATGIFSFVEAIETVQAIVLILGLILLVVEIFAPGFGIAGGAGLALIILGIVLTARNPLEATVMVIILLVLLAIIIAIILRSAKKGKLSKKLVLWSATRGEEGYKSTEDRKELIGREGVALTILRPSGSADFNGERLDVVTEGAFIQPNMKVKVVRVEGRRIVVRSIQEQET
jgi:membrane-bound ClpP family serine protease